MYSGSSEWQRAGRGKSVAVFTTSALVADWVAESIAGHAADLVLVGTEKRRKDGSSRFLTIPWVRPFSELPAVLAAGGSGQADRKEVYLANSGDVPPESVDSSVLTRFALNGCPRLYWHEEEIDGARLMFISHVDVITSTETGRAVTHDDYSDLYERIRKTTMANSVPVRGRYTATGWSGARVAKTLLEDG